LVDVMIRNATFSFACSNSMRFCVSPFHSRAQHIYFLYVFETKYCHRPACNMNSDISRKRQDTCHKTQDTITRQTHTRHTLGHSKTLKRTYLAFLLQLLFNVSEHYFTVDKRENQATILQYYSSFKRIFRSPRDVYTISSHQNTHTHAYTNTNTHTDTPAHTHTERSEIRFYASRH